MLRIFDPSSLSGNSSHKVSIKNKTCCFHPVNLIVRLLQRVVFVHKSKYIIEPTFDSQIQMPDSCIVKLMQLCVTFPADICHSRIHMNTLTAWEIEMNFLPYL